MGSKQMRTWTSFDIQSEINSLKYYSLILWTYLCICISHLLNNLFLLWECLFFRSLCCCHADGQICHTAVRVTLQAWDCAKPKLLGPRGEGYSAWLAFTFFFLRVNWKRTLPTIVVPAPPRPCICHCSRSRSRSRPWRKEKKGICIYVLYL